MTAASASELVGVPHPDEVEAQRWRELASCREEIQRYNVVVGLMRQELADARARSRSSFGGWRSGLGGMARTIDRQAHVLLRRLRLRDAEHAVRHGSPGWYGQLVRNTKSVIGSRRRRSLAAAVARSGARGLEDPVVARSQGLEQELAMAKLALAQSKAVVTLLRGELALRGRGRQVRSPRTPEAPEQLIRRGAVVPNDAMVDRLVGRVRVATVPDENSAQPVETGIRPTVTVATRMHDSNDTPSLERSLACLQAQRCVDVTPLVMFQGPEDARLDAVRESIARVWLGQPRPRLVCVPNPESTDQRSALLNRALDIHYGETANDFFYVLDHDDLVFSHALATMAGPVVGSDAAVSFGKVLVARYLSLDNYDFLYRLDDHFRSSERDIAELTIDNFFPIHGYVYHTRAMPPGRLQFNESMDRLEDYEALLRVVTDYPVYTGAVDTLVGLYCWKGQRAIHGPIEGASGRESERWDRNRMELAKAFVDVTTRPRESG